MGMDEPYQVVQFPLSKQVATAAAWATVGDEIVNTAEKAVFRLGNSGSWLHPSEPSYYDAMVHCTGEVLLAIKDSQLEVWSSDVSTSTLADDEFVPSIFTLSCNETQDISSFYVATASGTTAKISLSFSPSSLVESKIIWSAHDGLATPMYPKRRKPYRL